MAVEAVKHDTETRVGRLEVQLSQLVENFTAFAHTSERWRESVSRDISTLSDRLAERTAPKETNWTAVIGLCGSLVMVTVVVGGLVLLPMQKELNEVRADFKQHQNLKLHPVGKEQIDALKDDLQKAAARNEQAIKDLGLKLQREAAILVSSAEERAKTVQAQLEVLRDKSIPPLNERIAILQERMNVLVKQP